MRCREQRPSGGFAAATRGGVSGGFSETPPKTYSGSRIHAPNEHIRLADARQAIEAFAALMLLLPVTPAG
jgi:acetylornithine deacetylase/succinyl-diaminopimelate desuccinylase-like protein